MKSFTCSLEQFSTFCKTWLLEINVCKLRQPEMSSCCNALWLSSRSSWMLAHILARKISNSKLWSRMLFSSVQQTCRSTAWISYLCFAYQCNPDFWYQQYRCQDQGSYLCAVCVYYARPLIDLWLKPIRYTRYTIIASLIHEVKMLSIRLSLQHASFQFFKRHQRVNFQRLSGITIPELDKLLQLVIFNSLNPFSSVPSQTSLIVVHRVRTNFSKRFVFSFIFANDEQRDRFSVCKFAATISIDRKLSQPAKKVAFPKYKAPVLYVQRQHTKNSSNTVPSVWSSCTEPTCRIYKGTTLVESWVL